MQKTQEMQIRSLGWEDLLEQEMATHSCLKNSMDRGARRATVHGGHKELDMTEQLNNSNKCLGFPGGTVVKNLPANAEDTRLAASIPGLGRSRGVGNGSPIQYSSLEDAMDRGDWWGTVSPCDRRV